MTVELFYRGWLRQVDTAIHRVTDGVVSRDDLPDVVDLAALHEDGRTPSSAAHELLVEAGYFDVAL